jgi:asparagine N-glycosylation enzyme membrane subunit Stt3
MLTDLCFLREDSFTVQNIIISLKGLSMNKRIITKKKSTILGIAGTLLPAALFLFEYQLKDFVIYSGLFLFSISLLSMASQRWFVFLIIAIIYIVFYTLVHCYIESSPKAWIVPLLSMIMILLNYKSERSDQRK